MSLTTLSSPAFAAGLLALAGVLYLLQRLRVRHREVEVPTTLFWLEAVQETRARVFVQRFRHPWAYALVLLICGVVWLAVAEPVLATAGKEHVLVLDASAGMARGERLAVACQALRERARELPRERTRVVAVGARVDTLLERGEEGALLARRIEALRPDAVPAGVERALQSLAAAERAGDGVVIEVFGDAPVSDAACARLAGRAQVRRAPLLAEPSAPNTGVIALGISEAESGAWNAVDVMVEVAGTRAPDASAPVTYGSL